MQGSPQTSSDPAVADAANAAVLKEYGFSDAALATYTRDDGRTLKIRAARFEDASGAFGAYTFYLQPEMRPENTEGDRIGDQAASLGQRVLFYRGHVLVDAQFSQESAMSGSQLRELAGALPRPSGNNANLPTFIEFLPRRGYVANTRRYAMGPVALAALAPPVSAEKSAWQRSRNRSKGGFEAAHAAALAEDAGDVGFIDCRFAAQSRRVQPTFRGWRQAVLRQPHHRG